MKIADEEIYNKQNNDGYNRRYSRWKTKVFKPTKKRYCCTYIRDD